MFIGNYNLVHILELVKDAETIAVTGHNNPDGDCIGSTLAIYNYLTKMGKKVDVYLEPIGKEFNELPGSEVIKNEPEDTVYDVFFMLDLGDVDRIGVVSELFSKAKKTVCIDHHITSKGVADENFIITSLSSTCELVFEMMDLDLIDKDVAACLYTGIIHDTGVFHHGCTSKRTMQIAGELMDKGIDFGHIIDHNFYSKTYKQNQVLGRCLMESMILWDGVGVVSYLTRKEMDFYMIDSNDAGGIIDQLRLTEGVKVAILIKEQEPHLFKVSMRSTVTDIDVSKVAAFFGGGGHKMAAGCTISSGTVHDVINNITKQLQFQLKTKGYI
ncbi:MAG: DHH family phosphoesterase [Catonella sp.]|uniref:DHH family phosphoesterase n=1 Tax=Catonella sp. TaxID=2382125 RepID=UPI003FA05E40